MAYKTYPWKSPRPLGWAVVIVMALNILILAGSIFVDLTYGVSGTYPETEQEFTPPQFWRWAVDMLELMGLLACLVVPFWIVRVGKNARTFRRNMEVSPWGAVGWAFVPIMGFFKPYQAMSEIWRVSESGASERGEPLLIWWWGFWILSNGGTTATLSPVETQADVNMQIAVDLITLMSTLIFLVLVWRLTRMQVRKHDAWVASGSPPLRSGSVLEGVAG